MTRSALHRIALASAAALTVAGCQTDPHRMSEPDRPALHQTSRESVLDSADWSKRIDLTLELHDYGYRPRELRLKSGQPYRITLVNYGGANHYFTAPEFLAAVATRKAEVRNVAEFKAPVFSAFEVYARGGTLDLYIVPMVKGSYRAHCHVKDHEKLNIEGVVIIE